jgi:hypothetical protein
MVAFMTWLCERRACQEDVIFHENSRKFDTTRELEDRMAGTHDALSICIGNEDFGRPWPRVRMLTVLWKRVSLTWDGPPFDEAKRIFSRMYKRKVLLDGDAYFVDEERAVPELLQQCSLRGHHYPSDFQDVAAIPDAHHLTPTESLHKRMYGDKMNSFEDAAFLADLHQNPAASHESCGSFIPRMVTHGHIYSFTQGRALTKREILSVSGVPPDGGWYKDILDECSISEVMHLAGNGLAMPPAAAWLFFVLGHLVRKTELGPLRVLPLTDQTDEPQASQDDSASSHGDGPLDFDSIWDEPSVSLPSSASMFGPSATEEPSWNLTPEIKKRLEDLRDKIVAKS